MAVNKVILVGNAGKDPEVRYMDNGIAKASFPLATNEVYKKNNEKVTQTEWHNVVMWRNLAEIAEKFVRKGTLLYIEGKIRTRQWEDKDGNKRYTTEIVADNLQLLGKKSDEDPGPVVEQKQDKTDDFQPEIEESDDLPF